ncbi:hypothetical protein [Aeromonas veronii]|uniref:hypothetical protein n=1 Tax=Aeromonas veronii TaxID=654 RepID=UPI00191F494F|nr:hypothetical protein [Aeromonas veronii]MBL0616825.1 hypothetical protein [Aeromonas veronii]
MVLPIRLIANSIKVLLGHLVGGSVKRKIKFQGDLDGACFLYSIANAVISLNSNVTPENWSDAIELLPNSQLFLRQDVGTLAFDDDGEKLEKVAQRFINDLADEVFTLKLYKTNRKNMQSLIDDDSVVIICNPEHWFVVTEIYNDTVFIACSDVLNSLGNLYLEELSTKFGHISNLKVKLNELSVHGNMAFRVTKKQ